MAEAPTMKVLVCHHTSVSRPTPERASFSNLGLRSLLASDSSSRSNGCTAACKPPVCANLGDSAPVFAIFPAGAAYSVVEAYTCGEQQH